MSSGESAVLLNGQRPRREPLISLELGQATATDGGTCSHGSYFSVTYNHYSRLNVNDTGLS